MCEIGYRNLLYIKIYEIKNNKNSRALTNTIYEYKS